jgi:hypothetical protein
MRGRRCCGIPSSSTRGSNGSAPDDRHARPIRPAEAPIPQSSEGKTDEPAQTERAGIAPSASLSIQDHQGRPDVDGPENTHFFKRIVSRNRSRTARRLRRGAIEGLPAFMAASVRRQRLQPLSVGSRRSPATHPPANLRTPFRGGSPELPRFDPPTKRTIHRALR